MINYINGSCFQDYHGNDAYEHVTELPQKWKQCKSYIPNCIADA